MNDMVVLSQDFAALGADLRGDGDNDAAMTRIVQLAVKHVAACMAASITLRRGESGTSLAASDSVAEQADDLQYTLHEGPACNPLPTRRRT